MEKIEIPQSVAADKADRETSLLRLIFACWYAHELVAMCPDKNPVTAPAQLDAALEQGMKAAEKYIE